MKFRILVLTLALIAMCLLSHCCSRALTHNDIPKEYRTVPTSRR